MTNSPLPPSPTLPREVHGHDVIDFIRATGGGPSVVALVSAVEAQFGASTRFFTCSETNMDAAELIAFLLVREKIALERGRFVVNAHHVCAE